MEYTHSAIITFKNGEKKIISFYSDEAQELENMIRDGMFNKEDGYLLIGGVEEDKGFIAARVCDITTVTIMKIGK